MLCFDTAKVHLWRRTQFLALMTLTSEQRRGVREVRVEFAQKALGTPGKLRPNFQVSEVQFTILWTPLVDYIQCVCTGLHQIARIFQDLSPGEAFVKITDHCLQLCMIRHSLSGVCIEFQCIWSHGPVSNMHSVHSETEAHLWITSGMGSTFVGNIKCLNNLRSSKSFDVGAGDLVWIMWGSKH